jgi:hypothetical protein
LRAKRSNPRFRCRTGRDERENFSRWTVRLRNPLNRAVYPGNCCDEPLSRCRWRWRVSTHLYPKHLQRFEPRGWPPSFRKQSVKAPELQRLGRFPVTEIGSRIFKFYQRYFQLANRYRRLHNPIPPPKNHPGAYCKACLTRFLSDVIAHIELCTANSCRTKTTVCTTPEPRPPAGESDAPICHCAALTVLLVFANYWLLRAKKRNPMRLLAATSGVWEW